MDGFDTTSVPQQLCLGRMITVGPIGSGAVPRMSDAEGTWASSRSKRPESSVSGFWSASRDSMVRYSEDNTLCCPARHHASGSACPQGCVLPACRMHSLSRKLSVLEGRGADLARP